MWKGERGSEKSFLAGFSFQDGSARPNFTHLSGGGSLTPSASGDFIRFGDDTGTVICRSLYLHHVWGVLVIDVNGEVPENFPFSKSLTPSTLLLRN